MGNAVEFRAAQVLVTAGATVLLLLAPQLAGGAVADPPTTTIDFAQDQVGPVPDGFRSADSDPDPRVAVG